MEIIGRLLLDASSALLIAFSVLLAGICLSVVVLFLLPTSGSKKDLGGILLRLFSITALLKMIGVSAARAVVVTIIVTALFVCAFTWAGKRCLDIVVTERGSIQQVHPPATPVLPDTASEASL